MFIPRFSILALLAAFFPFVVWAADPNSGGGGGGNTDPAKPATPPAAPPVDVQAEINKALEAERTQFAAKLKEITGSDSLDALHQANLAAKGETEKLLTMEREKSAKLEGLYRSSAIRNSLLGAAQDSVDPETVAALLGGQAQVDDSGKVTVGGKDPAAAVADLLKAKPHLAKPAGGQGSGAGQGGGDAGNLKTEYEAAKAKGDARAMMDIKRRNGGKAP